MSGILNSIYNNTSFALHLHADAIGALQEQVSTGSRINRASDDPSAAYQVLGLNSQKRSLQNYMDNISEISSILETSTAIIQTMASAISQTRVSMNQILSGTYDETGRQRLAEQINDTLEQMVSLANTQNLGQYIFGGGNTSSAPYAVQRTSGEITSVTYQGSSQQRNIEVAPGVQSSAYYAGEDVFCSDNRDTPEFLGDTGAAAGSGTSSVKGNIWLTVTYDGSHYNLSIDDGATTVDVGDASDPSNVAVTNSSGQVLYVDATNINSTGVNMVSVPGTCDIFNTLITVRDLLKNERGLSDAQLSQFRSGLSDSLDETYNLLVEKETSIGSKIGFIDNLKNSLENIKNNTEDEATILQEADIAQLAIDITRRETLYQMSLAVAGRLMSMSLLDFIQ
ncbi:MAG: flagellar hook-associated protein FlgL [Phycisphaerae bacterium]|nr:flagellar hook-associated protein FlgL [Phycisphaerae bacterium]